MKKYKVLLDKKNCIGCMTCNAICENTFKPSVDGRVFVAEEEITEIELSCTQQAVDVCPVGAIQIEEIK